MYRTHQQSPYIQTANWKIQKTSLKDATIPLRPTNLSLSESNARIKRIRRCSFTFSRNFQSVKGINPWLLRWRVVDVWCVGFRSVWFCIFVVTEYLCLVIIYFKMTFYMSNICRLCMSRKDVLIPLFDNDNRGQTLSLPDKIMNFVPIIKVHHSTLSAYVVLSHEWSEQRERIGRC